MNKWVPIGSGMTKTLIEMHPVAPTDKKVGDASLLIMVEWVESEQDDVVAPYIAVSFYVLEEGGHSQDYACAASSYVEAWLWVRDQQKVLRGMVLSFLAVVGVWCPERATYQEDSNLVEWVVSTVLKKLPRNLQPFSPLGVTM